MIEDHLGRNPKPRRDVQLRGVPLEEVTGVKKALREQIPDFKEHYVYVSQRLVGVRTNDNTQLFTLYLTHDKPVSREERDNIRQIASGMSVVFRFEDPKIVALRTQRLLLTQS